MYHYRLLATIIKWTVSTHSSNHYLYNRLRCCQVWWDSPDSFWLISSATDIILPEDSVKFAWQSETKSARSFFTKIRLTAHFQLFIFSFIFFFFCLIRSSSSSSNWQSKDKREPPPHIILTTYAIYSDPSTSNSTWYHSQFFHTYRTAKTFWLMLKCVSVCVCVCIYIYIYIYIYTHTHTHIYIYTHT